MNNISGSFELFSLGGIIVIFIGILSIIAIAVILERFFYYRRVKILMDKAFKEIKLALAAKDYDKVLALIKSYGKLPLATILKAGIEQVMPWYIRFLWSALVVEKGHPSRIGR